MLKLKLRDKEITTKNHAFVMGIVNVTPDSFWENSRGDFNSSVNRAFTLIEQGADILDIGAESTRPGSEYVSEEEELKRIIPVIKEIRKKSDIAISIDTRKKNVMQRAFEEGADILNDVSAMEDDVEMAFFVSKSGIPVILMHKRGNPSVMQNKTDYKDAFNEVNTYLQSRVQFALHSGIKKDKIIVDPGIGFGKNLEANISLITSCGSLCNGEYPVLMALSRKTCIGEMTGKNVEERLSGTLAADMLSVINGASILRVHDVNETIDTLKILEYIYYMKDTSKN